MKTKLKQITIIFIKLLELFSFCLHFCLHSINVDSQPFGTRVSPKENFDSI
jgi:hypothetical protein